MNKTFTTGIILGVCAIIAILAAWNTISVSNTVSSDHAVLSQVVTIIKNAQNQASGASTTPTPATK